MTHNCKWGLSLYQPFANLITLKHKLVETRFYQRKFRGDLLICAAQKIMPLPELKKVMTNEQYHKFLEIQRKAPYDLFGPTGVAMCVVNVVDWRPMNKIEDLQTSFVAWDILRWVAVLDNIRPIVTFDLKGRQTIFPLTDKEQSQIEFGN